MAYKPECENINFIRCRFAAEAFVESAWRR